MKSVHTITLVNIYINRYTVLWVEAYLGTPNQQHTSLYPTAGLPLQLSRFDPGWNLTGMENQILLKVVLDGQ